MREGSVDISLWWAVTGSNCWHLACKASALPAELTAQIKKWCLRAESNHWHGDFQSPALPTELPRQIKMATRRGLEPLTSAVTGRHSNQLNYRAILTFIAVFLCELLSHEPASIVYYFKTILSTLFWKKFKKVIVFIFPD